MHIVAQSFHSGREPFRGLGATRRPLVFPLLPIATAMLLANAAVAHQEPANTLSREQFAELDFLTEGLEAWYAQAEFICTYQLDHGVCDREGLADARTPVHIRKSTTEAEGLIAKSDGADPMYRFEIDYRNSNIPVNVDVPGISASMGVRNISQRELIKPEIGILFHPDYADIQCNAFSRPDDELARANYRVTTSVLPLNPLSSVENSVAHDFRKLVADARDTQSDPRYQTRVSLHDLGDGRSEIEFEVVHRRRNMKDVYAYVLRTAADHVYPELAEIVTVEPGSRSSGCRAYLSDFASCPRSQVARKVTLVWWSSVKTNSDAQCMQWRTSDLGDRLPSDEDFTLTAPAGTRYKGCPDSFNSSEEQVIRLASLTSNDGMNYGETIRVKRPNRQLPTATGISLSDVLLAFVGVTSIVGLGVAIRRRIRRGISRERQI